MISRVVDTNVAVVANGRDVHASTHCRMASVALLMLLRDGGRTVIDDHGGILTEYRKRLRPQGQPGVGDLFFRHVLDNRGNSKSVFSVDTNGDRATALREAFARGGLAAFDLDDRIFALAAAVSRAPVATATDSDWPMHEIGLSACGVRVDYACGKDVAERGGSE